MMGVVNVVLLVLLVWTFTSVCEDDDNEITSICEDVTAHVGDKINLNCTVTYQEKECCMQMYKIINTVAADDPTICREDFNKDPCIEMSSSSCLYTANKAMTSKFKFFLQTTCGNEITYFSVIITEAVKGDTAGGQDPSKGKGFNESTEETSGLGITIIAVIITALSCFFIVAVALFLWIRRKLSRSQLDYNMAAIENTTHNSCEQPSLLLRA